MIRRIVALGALLVFVALVSALPVMAQDAGYETPTPIPTLTDIPPTSTERPPTEPPPTVPPTEPPSPRPTPSVPPPVPPEPPTPPDRALAVTGLGLTSGAAGAAVLIGGGVAMVRGARRRAGRD